MKPEPSCDEGMIKVPTYPILPQRVVNTCWASQIFRKTLFGSRSRPHKSSNYWSLFQTKRIAEALLAVREQERADTVALIKPRLCLNQTIQPLGRAQHRTARVRPPRAVIPITTRFQSINSPFISCWVSKRLSPVSSPAKVRRPTATRCRASTLF